jgi:lon-related putative ATP-dependent protease
MARHRTNRTASGAAPVDVRHLELPPETLRWQADPSQLPFETTAEVEPLVGVIGQQRAVEALAFGLDMRLAGFNVFVSGPVGTGRTTTTQTYVASVAETKPTPGDWCYVHNFRDPYRPIALGFPAGRGREFARDLEDLVQTARREIPRAFESPEYRQRREEIHRTMEQERDRIVQELAERARRQGFALSITPLGIVTVPLVDERPMTREEFQALPPEERRRREEESEKLTAELGEVLRRVRLMEKEAHERMAQFDKQAAAFILGPIVRDLREKYRGNPKVVDYLERVQEDIVEHLAEFRRGESVEESAEPPADERDRRERLLDELERLGRERIFERYQANVLVDNATLKGAPVVFEPNPTYYNLLGRIEYHVRLGATTTDFHMIKPGALHRANGGYLILDALQLLTSPFAWDALKRALRTREVRVENIGEQFTLIPTATLRPEPIPLDVKVVLIGPRLLYYLLYFYDEEFRKLFKVKSDFDVEMDRTPEHVMGYAAFVSRQVREQGLRPFHRSAVARLAEHGARILEHQGKLTTRFIDIADLVAEANHWAGEEGSDVVRAEHVNRAIAARERRSNLLEEKVKELIEERTIFIDSTGARTGQVNGLAIIDLGDYLFGRPVRVTAQTSLGTEGVVNIDREARLSGRIHNKAFLILSSFLQARYAQDKPLALVGRITFEQSYDEIEGDSASSTELYALLSSLADLPLRQDVAVTGSINQLGEVQPVGGVTRKIEGFFDLCRMRGLTGQQGVIIPKANVKHLMLRDDVVEAVRQGRFHIWAVETVDQGVEILTGVPAGRRRADGTWEEGTVNARVDRKLQEYAERLKRFGRGIERVERAVEPAEVGPRAPRVPPDGDERRRRARS